ncbi:MAG: hypothetical protein IT442_10040 [Phycisphaeraceae bacterium]|nr:hypothetical protein [Phycisphaeraceae bacterium]
MRRATRNWSKGGRRWLAFASLGLTVAVVGMWGRSTQTDDTFKMSLPARSALELDSCGGVILALVIRYEKGIDELDRAPLWSWSSELAHGRDGDFGAMQSMGIPVDYPWDRPHWKLARGRLPTRPPRIPVGWSYTQVNFPYWAVALVVSAPLVVGLGVMMRQGVRGRRGRCPLCGYDLRGTEGEACPECGAGFERVVRVRLARGREKLGEG